MTHPQSLLQYPQGPNLFLSSSPISTIACRASFMASQANCVASAAQDRLSTWAHSCNPWPSFKRLQAAETRSGSGSIALRPRSSMSSSVIQCIYIYIKKTLPTFHARQQTAPHRHLHLQPHGCSSSPKAPSPPPPSSSSSRGRPQARMSRP